MGFCVHNYTVVPYSIPTSKHNVVPIMSRFERVVPYSIPTSKHNSNLSGKTANELYLIPFLHQNSTETESGIYLSRLYLIPFLHQNTTIVWHSLDSNQLYLIPFLHQNTTVQLFESEVTCCTLFHSYIKTQLRRWCVVWVSVVPYSIPTSKHNHKLIYL